MMNEGRKTHGKGEERRRVRSRTKSQFLHESYSGEWSDYYYHCLLIMVIVKKKVLVEIQFVDQACMTPSSPCFIRTVECFRILVQIPQLVGISVM